MHPVLTAGYVALFVAIGAAFLCVNLLVGWLVRPRAPNAEKLEVYECGEPAIGSSFVQFDLRFYVVALLFIIFDVEVALFFPWATVFGKAVQMADPSLSTVLADGQTLTPAAAGLMRELGLEQPAVPIFPDWAGGAAEAVTHAGTLLARTAAVDMSAFFAVLLVGFAYVWYRGDLDWVRAVSSQVASGQSPAAGGRNTAD
ncbi:MAG: NADH-quinone oxidoreductase subunit A [Planctomycetota bacterium]